jgi:hypothetical protein
MSEGFSGAASPDSGGGLDRELWRAAVAASVVAAAAVCLAGTVAIASVTAGASTVVSLTMMGAVLLVGSAVACGVIRSGSARSAARTQPIPPVSSRGIRRADRAHRRAVRRGSVGDEKALLEQLLSARYGVPVERVAWHVWLIKGELVEATFDQSTGQLISGGRELRL